MTHSKARLDLLAHDLHVGLVAHTQPHVACFLVAEEDGALDDGSASLAQPLDHRRVHAEKDDAPVAIANVEVEEHPDFLLENTGITGHGCDGETNRLPL